MGAKISGELIGEVDGVRIYARLTRAKRKGKDRLSIHIRQDNPRRWRVAATLSYENSIDIRLEDKEPSSLRTEVRK